MPWRFPWSENIKKRSCRYLLQRYLGQFLKEKLTLEQLSIDIYEGTGHIKDILLDVEALNELGAANNLPFEFVDGFIGEVRLSVPWSSLLTASSHAEISRLLLTVRAKPMHTDAAMFDSMLDSMSASTLDLAKECLAAPQGATPTGWGGPGPTDTGAGRDASETLDGIEALARAIDSVLLRIKVRLLDTTIRLEHVGPNDAYGVGLELRIERADYMDEAGRELMSEEPSGSGRTDAAAPAVTSAIACKRLTLHGVSLHSDEFPSQSRRWPGSMAASFAEQKSCDSADEEYTSCRQTDGTAVPVLITRLHGSTVLGWQVKLDDSVPGPKMSVHMTSSSLCSLLSPRQFHGLSSLLSGFVDPQTDHSRDARRPAGGSDGRFPAEKPMTRDDYQLIEEQLMRGNLASRHLIASSHALSNQGWSGNIIDDDDDEYVSLCRGESGGGAAAATYMTAGGGAASDVMETSGVSSLMSGSVYSESTRSEYSHQRSRARRRRDRLKYEESGSDSIQFRVQLATVAVSLLHDDVLTTDPDTQTLTPDSCKQMDALAESFLRRTSTLLVGGFGGLTSDQCRQVLLEACPLSHISLVAAPMKLECSERPIGGRSVVSLRLDCGRLELLECLVENGGTSSDGSTSAPTPVYTELMMFDSRRQQGCSTAALTLTLRHSQLSPVTSAQTAGRGGATNHVAVRVTLAAGCLMEVDPSLVDRVSALLFAPPSSTNGSRAPSALATPSPRPADQSAASAAANQQCFNDMVNDTTGSVSRVDLQVSSSAVDIRLRIPVADLRPPSDMSRTPWWRRCVRPDSFHLLLEDACLSTSWPPPAAAATSAAAASDGCSWRLELQARHIRLAYSMCEDERSEPPLVFMQVTSGGPECRGDGAGLLSGATDCGDGLDWPRLVVTGWPYTTSLSGDGVSGGGLLLDDRPADSCPTVSGPAAAKSGGSSPIDGLATDGRTDPSPFSRRRVVYDTDAHSRGDTDPDATEGDELTVPADRVQVDQFIDNTLSNCRLLLDFSLPCVQALLPSKQFYDNVYNRLSNDLALWEPSSPLAVSVPGAGDPPPACRTGLYTTDSASLLQDDPYQMCRSATQYDSDSGSDGDGGVFYSVYEQRQRQWRRQRRQDELIRSRQSRLCCRVRLDRGTLALHTPALDDEGSACSDHHGEMQLFARSGSLFVVTGYGGVYNHGYVCVAADSIQLYHKAQIPTSSATAALPSLDSAAPYLQRIVYLTDCAPHADGGDLNSPGHGNHPAMLSVSVKYQLDDTNNIKTFTVAVGLHGCTVRYLPVCSARHLFFNQLIDMLDTRDIVVPGYCVPATVTELHLQISQSAVDYRPVSLPYRYLVTADSLTISSHLVAGTSVSVLRVILEEAALHVSPSSASSSSVALPQFVCVLDAGLLELSVRMCDVTSEDGASGFVGAGRLPGADWRVNNNRVRLRTCADSLRALVRLLTHLTGGAEATTATSTPPAAGSPIHQLLTPVTPETRQVPQQQSPTTDAGDGTSEDAQRGLETMLEDAMLDTSPKLVEPVSVNQGPVEVFFFPNEPHVAPPPPAQQAEDAQPINTVMASMAEALADMDAADRSTAEDHEGFCVLEDDLGVGIRSRTGEPQVRCLSTGSVRLVENHFPAPTGRADVLRAPAHFPVPRFRFTLQHLSLSWCMFGGHDLPVPADGAPLPRKVRIESPPSSPSSTEGAAVQLIRSPTRRNEDTALYTKHDSLQRLLPSHLQFGTLAPPIGESGKHQRRPSWRHRLRGGPHRQQDKLMELKLTKVRCQYERYPDSTEQASRVVLTVHDVEVLDRLASSDINKFLYQYSSENCLRQAHTSMLLVKALVRRPDPSVSAEECDVRVSGCPVRLNVDQDALFFLRDFFLHVTNAQSNASSSSTSSDAALVCAPPTLSISPRLSEQPASSATTAPASAVEDSAEHPQTNSTAAEVTSISSRSSTPVSSTSSGTAQQPTYFRALTFSPEVLIRVDYRGRRVDMGQFGPLVGLIVGLGQLNCCEIRLKRICHRTGVLGVERLLNHVLNEWLTDIRRNQLPSLLGGIGPMHCFLQLFQGVRDLVWLPIEQYRKDGRIVKGLQRGANSFSTSTAMALLELTSQLVGCIQCASELAYDMLTPGPTVRQQRVQRQKRRRQHRRHQLQQHDQQGLQDVDTRMPHDLREGVNNAYQLVKEGLGDTAQMLVRVASLEHDQKGVSGAVGGVLRQIPPTVVTPLLLVSQATGNVLGGMRNQLAPDARREALDKWKTME